MTIRIRGNSFMVDVKVHASISPTGQSLRVRAAFPSHAIARRMEVLIRGDLVAHGTWARDPRDYQVQAHQPAITNPKPSPATPRSKARLPETEDQLRQRRARILRAMGEYPRLAYSRAE